MANAEYASPQRGVMAICGPLVDPARSHKAPHRTSSLVPGKRTPEPHGRASCCQAFWASLCSSLARPSPRAYASPSRTRVGLRPGFLAAGAFGRPFGLCNRGVARGVGLSGPTGVNAGRPPFGLIGLGGGGVGAAVVTPEPVEELEPPADASARNTLLGLSAGLRG